MGRSAKEGGKNIERARKLVEARPYGSKKLPNFSARRIL